MLGVYLVIISYALPLVVCFFLWQRVQNKVKVFQAVWVFTIMFMLNAYGLVYAIAFSKDVLPLGVSLQKYFRGSVINLIFVILWGVGYWVGVGKDIVIQSSGSKKESIKRVGVWATRVLLVISGLSTVFFYSMGISYGETVFDYSSLPVYFGPVAAFKNLFLPTAAAYLMIVEKVQQKRYRIQSLPIEKILWVAIGLRVVIGATLDMQRGDIVYPILVLLVVLIAKGYVKSRKKIFTSIVFAGAILIILSPILDILRQPAVYDKNVSIDNIISAVETISKDNTSGLMSWSTILHVPYSKSILPASTYALSKEVSENGHIYFKTYDDPIIDMIPRFVWPEKPWPLSVTGETRGTAAGISAKNLGKSNIIWVIGGGTMYWQFGWIGVIIGGAIVGFIWGQMTQKMLFSVSPFLLIIFFSMFRWGIHYVESVDKLLLFGLREVRSLLIIWIPLLIVIRAVKK